MRAVIQRVREASVEIGGKRTASIEKGLLVLLAAGKEDTDKDISWMADKIAGLRIFPDDTGKMDLSLLDTGGAMLVISQFTLYGDCRKGRRPSFAHAMPPEQAEPLCQRFVEHIEQSGIPCATGVFGADMQVALVNDGPVTLLVDSSVPRRRSKGGFGH